MLLLMATDMVMDISNAQASLYSQPISTQIAMLQRRTLMPCNKYSDMNFIDIRAHEPRKVIHKK